MPSRAALTLDSYIVLALIGLLCILVYLLVSRNERDAVQQRVRSAHDSFRQRWRVVKKNYGCRQMQAQLAQDGDGDADAGMGTDADTDKAGPGVLGCAWMQ